MTVNVHA